MTRRTFLRVLGSAAVVAALPASLPDLLAAADTASSPVWSTGSARPLTYEMLRASYESCVIGRDCPTLAVCSASMARRLGLVYDVDLDVEQAA